MNVNTGMPAGYINPWQQWAMNMYGNLMQPAQQIQPTAAMQQQAQPTTNPMIQATLIEAPSEEWARQFNVAPGQTQMFYLRDESAMFVKTANTDGSEEFDVFAKQPRKPAPEYMTREQVEAMILEAKGDVK